MSVIILTGGGPKDPPPPPPGGRAAASPSIAEQLREAADQLDAEIEGKSHSGKWKVWLGEKVGHHKDSEQ